MTPDQYRAGWRDLDQPDAPAPVCIGSGQAVLLPVDRDAGAFSAAWDTCPECTRRIAIVRRDGVDVLTDHEPPELPQASRPDPRAGWATLDL